MRPWIPGAAMPLILLSLLHTASLAVPAGGFPEGYWRRTPLQEQKCGQTWNRCSVRVQTEDIRAAEKRIRSLMDKWGAVEVSSACSRATGYPSALGPDPVFLVWLPEKLLPELQREVLSLGNLLEWNSSAGYNRMDDDVLRKWEILTNELEKNRKILEKTPHVLALVKSEISRLEPHVEPYLKTTGMKLLRLQLQGRSAPTSGN